LQKEIFNNFKRLSLDSITKLNKIDSFYINKNKQDLFSTHNKVFIKSKEFTFDESFLVIDLGEQEHKGPFWLIHF